MYATSESAATGGGNTKLPQLYLRMFQLYLCCKIGAVCEALVICLWRWLGHMLRMSHKSVTHRATRVKMILESLGRYQ